MFGQLGLGLPYAPAKPFSISDLFANGTYAGFDFTDLDVTKVWGPGRLKLLYKDLLNTPVASGGDAVNLALDKSQGVAIGAESVTNGGFDVDASWTKGSGWSISGGAANLNASTGFTSLEQVCLAIGVTYVVEFDYEYGGSGPGLRVDLGSNNTVSIGDTTSGHKKYIAKATGTSLKFANAVSQPTAYSIDNVSVKAVSGNHALQSTSGQRPTWQANSGKPFLSHDGVDDALVTSFVPTAAMTLACAFNSSTGSGVLLGGGDSGSSHRALLALDSSGKLAGGWGAQSTTTIVGGSDIRSANHVGLLTADATSVDLYLDGAQVYSGAPSGSPSGGTGGMALGAFNNAGTLGSFSAAHIHGALCLNRRVTPSEIANITSKLRSTYP